MNKENYINTEADHGWNIFYTAYSKLVATHGADSAEAKSPTDPQLRAWVDRQRYLKRSGLLEYWKEAILNREGFDWDFVSSDAITVKTVSRVLTVKVATMLSKLAEKSCAEIINSDDADEVKLYRTTLAAKNKGSLTSEMVDALTKAGMIWSVREYKAANPQPSKAWTNKVNEMVSELSVRTCEEICDAGGKFGKLAIELRTGRRNGKLSKELEAKLNVAQFIWDWREFRRCRTWDMWFEKLEAWTKLNGGDPNMKRAANRNRAGVNNYTPAEETLANWVWTQRCDARKGKLNLNQIERLTALGVWLDRDAHTIEKAVAAMESHHAETGCWWNYSDHYSNVIVKDAAKAGTLTKALRLRLDALGFDENLDGRDLHWAKKVAEMVEFKAKHGHCDVSGFEKNYLRQAKKLGHMPDDVAAQFEALGFVWRERNVRRSIFDIVAELKEFRDMHGRWPKLSEELGSTINQLRNKFNRGEMSGGEYEALNEIGFEWDGEAARFSRTVASLKEFYDAHGRWPSYRDELGALVSRLRSKFNRGAMSGEDFEALCEIGFVWDARNPVDLAA